MIAGLLNLAGFLFTTTFLLGLYFEGIGPAKIEDKFSRIPRVIAIIICLLFFQLSLERYQHNFFSLSYLVFVHSFLWLCQFLLHEGGHIYWRIFGITLGTLGGALNEILLPLILSIYCFGKLYLRLSGLSLFFIGYNLKHLAWYIGDASAQATAEIPLHGIHDWKYLLDNYNMIEYIPLLSNIAYTLGVVSIYTGVLVMIVGVLKSPKEMSAQSH